MRSARASSGFTLIEVVVALSIFSLVMLAVVTGMRTLGNTQTSMQRVIDRVDEMRTVSSFLRDLLESAVVGSGGGGLSLGGGAAESTYFRLADEGVEWKTQLLFGEAFGGSYIVRVAQEGDELVLRWLGPDRMEPDSKKWDDSPSRVLVHGLDEFSVSLRDRYSSDWTEDWEDASVAPALVRMRIKANDRYWPDLVMRVQR